MKMEIIDGEFTVCKVKSMNDVNFSDDFVFFSKTDEEFSLVCRSENVPPYPSVSESGWRAMRIKGVLDFSLVGILSKITAVLASRSISVFAVSTYNTDYILVKKEQFSAAVEALKQDYCQME